MIFSENRLPLFGIIGEPSGLAFGKPKDRLRDAVLRTAMSGGRLFRDHALTDIYRRILDKYFG